MKHKTSITRLFREPLLHFLLIGCAVFALSSAARSPQPEAMSDEIVVSPAMAAQLVERFEAVWRRAPTVEEMEALIASYVREEVLVREATALGFDRDDAVIRQRLAQKMSFLLEGAAGARGPSEDDLRAFFEARVVDYTPPPRLGFEHVLLGPDPTDAEVGAAMQALQAGAPPDETGLRTMLPAALQPSVEQAVDGVFGSGFFAQLEDLEQGTWVGPVTSGFGVHLVRINEWERAAPPSFDAVRDRVEAEWRQQNTETGAEAQYARLLEGYVVRTPDPADLPGLLR